MQNIQIIGNLTYAKCINNPDNLPGISRDTEHACSFLTRKTHQSRVSELHIHIQRVVRIPHITYYIENVN